MEKTITKGLYRFKPRRKVHEKRIPTMLIDCRVVFDHAMLGEAVVSVKACVSEECHVCSPYGKAKTLNLATINEESEDDGEDFEDESEETEVEGEDSEDESEESDNEGPDSSAEQNRWSETQPNPFTSHSIGREPSPDFVGTSRGYAVSASFSKSAYFHLDPEHILSGLPYGVTKMERLTATLRQAKQKQQGISKAHFDKFHQDSLDLGSSEPKYLPPKPHDAPGKDEPEWFDDNAQRQTLKHQRGHTLDVLDEIGKAMMGNVSVLAHRPKQSKRPKKDSDRGLAHRPKKH